ncbi:Protein of unknown function [Pyronema omphalodes CBS 100304]|uniref:Uncharacterized protein n=1 Tax=Pyronema omphalodes (strain CBS 100304) TaxID=1076935 RepID=U4LBH0_PYROM|nr:Protein of unknown function [Pyronema omphalodes CBS 100304]
MPDIRRYIIRSIDVNERNDHYSARHFLD